MISVSFAPKRQAAAIDHFAPTNIGSLLRRYPYRVRIDPFYRGAQMGPVAAWVSNHATAKGANQLVADGQARDYHHG
jgi:hypothetical protein